jgi:hypothetical protein
VNFSHLFIRLRREEGKQVIDGFTLLDLANRLPLRCPYARPEWGSVEEIIYDAMQDVLGDELEHWNIFAAVRERRENGGTLH